MKRVRPLKPGAAGVVGFGIAGDHIGEPGLARCHEGEFEFRERRIGCGRWGACGWASAGAVAGRPDRLAARAAATRIAAGGPAPPQELGDAAGEEEDHERIEREQAEGGASTGPRRSCGSPTWNGCTFAPSGPKSSAARRSSRASALTASMPSGGP